MITTNDAALADSLRILRVHGSREKYQYEELGINSRLDALQAAILRVKLRHLSAWAEGRRRNADRYRSMFAACQVQDLVHPPYEPAGYTHVYNQFTIRTRKRDELRKHLHSRGIPTEIYYPCPLHLQPAYANLNHKPGDLPVTELAATEVLSLPVFPELTEQQQQSVVEAIAEFPAI